MMPELTESLLQKCVTSDYYFVECIESAFSILVDGWVLMPLALSKLTNDFNDYLADLQTAATRAVAAQFIVVIGLLPSVSKL